MGRYVHTDAPLPRSFVLPASSFKVAIAIAILVFTNCAGSSLRGTGSSISSIPRLGQHAETGNAFGYSTLLSSSLRGDAPWLTVSTQLSAVFRRHLEYQKRRLKIKAKSGMVFASDYNNNLVNCYAASGFNSPVIGTITSALQSPQGMIGTDQKITVASTGSSEVLVYNACGPQPVRTMNDSSGYPIGVAVDKNGNTYVTNILDSGSLPGEVRKYAADDNIGIQIGDNHLYKFYFVTVDTAGDLFVDGLTAEGVPELDWLPSGLGTQWKNTRISFGFPGGLGIDKNGNLLVDDQAGKLTAYSVPAFRPTGTSFNCPGGDCVSLQFDKSGDEVWIAAAAVNVVWGVRYPQGTPLDELTGGFNGGSLVIGVAITP
jgi:hypothetical protein